MCLNLLSHITCLQENLKCPGRYELGGGVRGVWSLQPLSYTPTLSLHLCMLIFSIALSPFSSLFISSSMGHQSNCARLLLGSAPPIYLLKVLVEVGYLTQDSRNSKVRVFRHGIKHAFPSARPLLQQLSWARSVYCC